MTKNDIIKEVSKETGFTNVEVELLLDSVINSIKISFPGTSQVRTMSVTGFMIIVRQKLVI